MTKSSNKNLQQANHAKKDEFYTQLSDIEKELKHYKNQFKGKVVYCNADDPFESNFFKYFALNFNALGLKKLIATSYTGSPCIGEQISLYDIEGLKTANKKEPMKIEINEIKDNNHDGAVDLSDVEWLLKNDKNVAIPLKENGDFRSNESIKILRGADIVATNPPFSLFREFVAQLMNYNKKFVILGNMNALTYKKIFKFIKENKIWSGYGFNMSLIYKSPYKNTLESNRKFVMRRGYNPDEYIKVPAVNWFTNLKVKKHKEDIILYKTYKGNKEEYPKYDNYDGIEVSKVAEIPIDYKKAMGVPITFVDKYNPNQFEIVKFRKGDDGKDLVYTINGEQKYPYFRILIKHKKF